MTLFLTHANRSAADHASKRRWPYDNLRHVGSTLLRFEAKASLASDVYALVNQRDPDDSKAMKSSNPIKTRSAGAEFKSLPNPQTKVETQRQARLHKVPVEKISHAWDEARSDNDGLPYQEAFR